MSGTLHITSGDSAGAGLAKRQRAVAMDSRCRGVRWLQEQPDPATELRRLEQLALEAIRGGCETPGKIFSTVVSKWTRIRNSGETPHCGRRLTYWRIASPRLCGSKGQRKGCPNGRAWWI